MPAVAAARDGARVIMAGAVGCDALATGALLAAVGAIHEFAARYMHGEDLTLILCGGGAAQIAPYIRSPMIQSIEPHVALCLYGLRSYIQH